MAAHVIQLNSEEELVKRIAPYREAGTEVLEVMEMA